MLGLIPGATVKLVALCCARDGAWVMKKEFSPLSKLTGKKASDEMAAAGAAAHFDQMLGRRRIRVGDRLSVPLENRDTVRYQIQEMLRIERIVKPADVAHKVESYDKLIPAPGELSAWLLIEYEMPEERDVGPRKLLGLEDHVWVQVCSLSPARHSRAVSDTRWDVVIRVQIARLLSFLGRQREDSQRPRLVRSRRVC